MRPLNLLLILALLAVIGTVFAPAYVPSSARPDLFLCLMIYVALRANRGQVLPGCWFVGLAQDLVSSGPPGSGALLYLLVGAAILRVRSEATHRPLLTYLPYAFSASVVTGAAGLLAVAPRPGAWPAPGNFHVLVASAFATTVAMLPCAWLLDRLRPWLGIGRRYRLGSA